jgi:hypothetical protein
MKFRVLWYVAPFSEVHVYINRENLKSRSV